MQRLLMSEGVWYPLTLTLTTFSWPLSAAQRRLAFGLLIGALRRADLRPGIGRNCVSSDQL